MASYMDAVEGKHTDGREQGIAMTREQVERTLERMDELVAALQDLGITESARLLQNAIDQIDYELEEVELPE